MNRARNPRPAGMRHATAGRVLGCLAAAALLPLLGAGCAASKLNTARGQYYQGQFDAAAATLAELPGNDTDRVLVLMERGAMQQAGARYSASVDDWLRANALADRLDLLSLSRSTASMVVNDNVLAYCGAPYERVLLHALAAQSYMAMKLWQDAAVEARILIRRIEGRGDYPDVAFGRYVAAAALELMGDRDGAAFQYRQAAAAARWCSIDPATGQLGPPVDTNALPSSAAPPPPPAGGAELLCFVGIGHGPSALGYSGSNLRWGERPYADIYAGETHLGRSYVLDRADSLMAATQKVLAARKTAKTVTRVALKETAAQVVSQQDEFLGDMLRLLLFATETPDERRWETLPQWLAVARVPCPADLKEFRIVFKTSSGNVVAERTVKDPLMRRGKTIVSFVREL